MKLSPLAAAALAASFASGYLVSPPGVAAPLTISTCSAWHLVVVADTCASVAAAGGLTLAQFVLYVNSMTYPLKSRDSLLLEPNCRIRKLMCFTHRL